MQLLRSISIIHLNNTTPWLLFTSPCLGLQHRKRPVASLAPLVSLWMTWIPRLYVLPNIWGRYLLNYMQYFTCIVYHVQVTVCSKRTGRSTYEHVLSTILLRVLTNKSLNQYSLFNCKRVMSKLFNHLFSMLSDKEVNQFSNNIHRACPAGSVNGSF